MSIVKTIKTKETANDYNFVIVEDEFGWFHGAYQFLNRENESIRLIGGAMNRNGYRTQAGARRVINQTMKVDGLTVAR